MGTTTAVEKRKLVTLLGIEPRYLGRWAYSLIAVQTEIFWFLSLKISDLNEDLTN
jgi:hypothetical protein